MPAAMHAAPAMIAPAHQRVPRARADRVGGSLGRQPIEERPVGRLRRRGRAAGSRAIAEPTIAATNGHTITSPGHGPTARTSSREPSTTAENPIVATRRRCGGPEARSFRRVGTSNQLAP